MSTGTRLLGAVVLLLAAAPASAQTVPLGPWSVGGPVIVFPSSGVTGAGVVTSPQGLFPDGTALLPAVAYAAEPTTGFWRSGAATVTLQGALLTTGSINTSGELKVGSTNALYWNARAVMSSPANGIMTVSNNAVTIGSELKVDALPTVAANFGTSPSVTAGSTPFSGQVNVGTGGIATVGTINFNGTAFPSAPFCVVTANQGAGVQQVSMSTTQLSINTSVAWPASTLLNWMCISAK